MSLDAWEERTLSCVVDELAHSAPELTSLLTVFNRLTSGEEMPDRGQPGETRKGKRHRSRTRRRRSGAGRQQSRDRQRVWPVIVPLAIAVITAPVIALLLMLCSHGAAGSAGCAQLVYSVCTGHLRH